jgi:small neutral amino acid transporter SnatA (MarC family)
MTDFLLVLLGLLLVLNPLGAALHWTGLAGAVAAARGGQLVLLAAIFAFALLVVAALIAAPLLDLLRISEPNWRIATAVLLVLGVLPFFIQHDPFAPAWFGAEPSERLVVARMTLWLATPAALALAISFSVDEGLPVTLLALLAAVTMTFVAMFFARAMVARVGRFAARELARLTAAAVVVMAVLLIRSGVYGV